jgi:uncharacterized protein (TIGR02145 family)
MKMCMKKPVLFALPVALCLALFTAACGEGNGTDDGGGGEPLPVKVAEVTLDAVEAMISPIETMTLHATVLPEDASNKAVVWESDNETVATVSDKGVVTPADGAAGVAVITATSTDDETIKASCTVTVNLVGTVSFRTETVWEVGEQTWSDAVMASGARKDDFDGGYYISIDDYEWKADCRQNEGYGDCFSWQAIMDYGDVLCPEPWRVPTVGDFVALDIALGGTGLSRGPDETTMTKYLSRSKWGAEFGGFAFDDQILLAGANAYYCTQTEAAFSYSRNLFLRGDATYYIRPDGNEPKFNGWVLRCVK